MRNIKILGLALVAMLALGAMTASAASATSLFTAEDSEGVNKEATITGVQEGGVEDNQLVIGSSYVTCEEALYHGVLPAGSSPVLDTTFEYINCETNFGTNATVHDNGCSYRFNAGAGTPGDDVFHGTADLRCPPEKDLTVTLGLCTIHVAPQADLTGITFTNKTESNPTDVTVDVDTTVKAVVTNVFLCPISTGEHNATLKTKVTVTAEELGGGTQYNALVSTEE